LSTFAASRAVADEMRQALGHGFGHHASALEQDPSGAEL
jgi:hypothetical protein